MPVEPLTFAIGRGLDRATGGVAVSPSAPVDVRNAYAKDAKMVLAPGMRLTGFPALTWGTDVIAVVPIAATLDELLVVYDRASRQIRVFRIDTINGTLQTIASPVNGLWGTLDAAAEFPVVVGCEAQGLIFLAHCEAQIANRLPTIYYTPDFTTPTNVGTLTTYTADLNGDSVAEPCYFSFVFTYLEYLAGVGFGSASDPDRGDIVRLSQPAAPLDMRPPNYALFGVKKDPILALNITNGPAPVPGGIGVGAGQSSVLVAGKASSLWVLNGTSFDNFTPDILDPIYGVVSPRAMQNVNGVLYVQSSDGARIVTAQTSTPIAQPLDLTAPLPDDFPALGPSRLCFSSYDSDRKILSWCYPDNENNVVPVAEFMLSLWNPSDQRWTFRTRQQCVACAGLLLVRDTGSLQPAPVGYVSNIVAVDGGIASNPLYRSVSLLWQNNLQTGSELVQFFARPSGGAWSLVRTVAVAATSDQVSTWDTALPLEAYDLAIRYVNGATPAVGYESVNPDAWTATTAAGSKTTVTTSTESVAWGAATVAPALATLRWVSAQTDAAYLLEKSTDGGGSYSTVVADLVATQYGYVIPGGEANTTVRFRLTAKRGTVTGPTAGTLDVYLGVAIGIPTITLAFLTVGTSHAPPFPLRAYIQWDGSAPGATASFVKLRGRDYHGGAPGAWLEGPTSAFSAPSVQAVPAQPDGFVPVGVALHPSLPASLNVGGQGQIGVALGIPDGSGGITWGPWVDQLMPLVAVLFDPPLVQPAPTFGALSSTQVPVTLTVPADAGSSQFPVFVFFDNAASQAGAWGMGLLISVAGVNTKTLQIPPAWRGATLYSADWTNFYDTGFHPTFYDVTPFNAGGAPTRNLVGSVP